MSDIQEGKAIKVTHYPPKVESPQVASQSNPSNIGWMFGVGFALMVIGALICGYNPPSVDSYGDFTVGGFAAGTCIASFGSMMVLASFIGLAVKRD